MCGCGQSVATQIRRRQRDPVKCPGSGVFIGGQRQGGVGKNNGETPSRTWRVVDDDDEHRASEQKEKEGKLLLTPGAPAPWAPG